MKKKFIPTPLTIIQPEEPIYIAFPTPIDRNVHKIVTPYEIIRIVKNTHDSLDDLITPVTPITPYTPGLQNKPFYHAKTNSCYFFYHPKHNCVRPIKDSAPTEAPPPIPYEIECIG